MRQPWTTRQIAVTALASVVGAGAAFFAFWFGLFLLPDESLFSTPNTAGDRALGTLAAVVVAVGAPAGLWAAAVQRRSRPPAAVATLVGVVVLTVAGVYALTAT